MEFKNLSQLMINRSENVTKILSKLKLNEY